MQLCVNVSARNLQDRHFGAGVMGVDELGFPAERLELEITERAIATEPERSLFTIERVARVGVRVSRSTTSAPATRRSSRCATCAPTA